MTHYYAPPTEISVVEDSWILIAALAVIGVIGLGIFGAVLTAQSSGPHFSCTAWTAAACTFTAASILAGQDNQAASDSVYR